MGKNSSTLDQITRAAEAKQRSRRRYQVLAGVICLLIVAIGVYFFVARSPTGSLVIVRHPEPVPWQRGRLAELPSYDAKSPAGFQVDVTSADLSDLDLRGRLADLMHADFDDRTVWPENLPESFDPQRIMNLGRNPGLRVRELHEQGVTGKGVGIGIIDQSLLVDHVEYRDQLRLYEEIHCADICASMHGAAVSSIAVGKTVGVAPEADLYFIGETHGTSSRGSPFKYDFQWTAKSIDRLLEINRTLPPDRKIRVISLSAGWVPPKDGYEEANQAVERAKKENVFVISTTLERTHQLAFHGLGRDSLKDPDDVQSYGPGSGWREQYFSESSGWGLHHWPGQLRREHPRLMVPMDSRCVASQRGTEQYVFYASGGVSWCVPYLSGLYALACQVKPTVTPEEFWSVGLETGQTIKIQNDGKTHEFGKIVDPVALVDALTGEAPARQTAISRDQAERWRSE
jgi:hypothetical protein